MHACWCVRSQDETGKFVGRLLLCCVPEHSNNASLEAAMHLLSLVIFCISPVLPPHLISNRSSCMCSAYIYMPKTHLTSMFINSAEWIWQSLESLMLGCITQFMTARGWPLKYVFYRRTCFFLPYPSSVLLIGQDAVTDDTAKNSVGQVSSQDSLNITKCSYLVQASLWAG